MPEPYTANDLLNAIAVASKTLSERKDEINRLNVFPVPDGDTGTNMSLTLETVVENPVSYTHLNAVFAAEDPAAALAAVQAAAEEARLAALAVSKEA